MIKHDLNICAGGLRENRHSRKVRYEMDLIPIYYKKLPDALLHEAIGVLCREGGQRGLGHHSLLHSNQLGVGLEVGTLVDVDHSDGDGGRGLARGVDASGQGNLVPRLHRQHIRPTDLKVDRLEKTVTERIQREDHTSGCRMN